MSDELKDETEAVIKAARQAHKYLADTASWSGAAGNWPLQDTERDLRLALEAYDKAVNCCPRCKGKGEVLFERMNGFLYEQKMGQCPDCWGSGVRAPKRDANE